MGGLHRHMKITSITFLIGCLAISGIPGFSGFFSKDEILASAFASQPVFFGFVLFAALLTAFYMFRLYFLTFRGSFRGTHDQEHHLHESPAAMTFPLIVLAILSIVGGYIGIPAALGGSHRLSKYLGTVIHQDHLELSHSTEYMLMGISSVLVVIVILFAFARFKTYKAANEPSGFGSILQNKWYVDEIYDIIVVRPLKWMSSIFDKVVEARIIDGAVNGVGKIVQYSSRQLRWVQSGQVGAYVLLMVIGMIILFVTKLFL
jgi:NADH-quinone oxidoreductase subunit L